MFNPNTLGTVAPLAQALTNSNRALVVVEGTPAAEVASCYTDPAEANGLPYSDKVAQVAQEDFEQANAEVLPEVDDNFTTQVNLMAKGIQTVGYNARNVLIPAIDSVVAGYNEKQGAAEQPAIEVNVFKYDPVHSDPRLTNHVASKYNNVQSRPEYQTFLLNPASPEQIIEMVSTENPHLDQPQVTDWLLQVGAERIQGVWQALFGTARVLDPSRISFLMPSNLPKSIDELLLAYCLAGHFMDHPQDVVGESVTLDQWNRVMAILHELFGAVLLKAYEYRADDIRTGKLVIEYNARDPLKHRTVQVLANGDVYPSWSANGGNLEALMGAAVYSPQLRHAAQIDASQADLAERWQKLYPLLDGACKDYSLRKRRENLMSAFLQPTRPLPEQLPQLSQVEVAERMQNAMQQISNEDLENPFCAAGKLVTSVYYPNPIYGKFLNSYEKQAKVHPGATGREIAMEAYIDIAADWLAQQYRVVPFVQSVDPVAVQAQADADAAENEQAVDQAEAAATQAVDAVNEANAVEPATTEQTDAEGNTDTSESTPVGEEQGGVVPTVSTETEEEQAEAGAV